MVLRKWFGGLQIRRVPVEGNSVRGCSIVLLFWLLAPSLLAAQSAGGSVDSTAAVEDSPYPFSVVAEHVRAGRAEGLYVALKPAAGSYVGGPGVQSGLSARPTVTAALEYQLTKIFGVGLSYQYASETQAKGTDPGPGMGHLAVSAGIPGKRLSPYAQLGVHRLFDEREATYGLDAGLGLDWKLSPRISVFPELAFNVTPPALAEADERLGGIGSFGIGMRVNLFRRYVPPAVRTISGPGTVLAGETARFEADVVEEATGPVTYEWRFAGRILRGNPVEHVFSSPGRFEVVLETSNRAGTHRSRLDVDVLHDRREIERDDYYVAPFGLRPIRIVSIDGPTVLSAGELANFRVRIADGAARPVIHRWDLGDGTPSQGNNVSHRYERPGRYTIIVSARNRKGSDADTLEVTVTERRPAPQPLEASNETVRAGSGATAGSDSVIATADAEPSRNRSLRGFEPIHWVQGGYTLLAVSATSRPAAEVAALQFRRKGYRSGIYLDDAGPGSAVFRVVVGQFGSESAAAAARRQIVRAGLQGAFIVQPLPPH